MVNGFCKWFSMEKPTNVFFGPGTIAPDGFSMVGNHWSNIGMVTNNDHRYCLPETIS